MDRIPGSEWIGGEGGSQVGASGDARSVWHSTEGPSIAAAVSAYRSHRGWPHATWDPNTGEIVQHLLPSQSARSVENRPGGVETNRYGKVLQIEVVAYAAHPFTNGPLVGLDRVLAWMRANGVPDVWPMGQPLAYGPDERRPGVSPAAYGTNNGQRNAAMWAAHGGHYAHSQVPENDHGDPGRIDITRLLGSPTATTLDTEDTMLYLHADNGTYWCITPLWWAQITDNAEIFGLAKAGLFHDVDAATVTKQLQRVNAQWAGFLAAQSGPITNAVATITGLFSRLFAWLGKAFPKKTERAGTP